MTDSTQEGWQPDNGKMGNWRAMFEQPRGSTPTDAPTPPPSVFDDAPLDDAPADDLRTYRPWVLQRGRSRPAMMLELRRFEARAGMWQGWVMSYPALRAVAYMGDRMLSLDFGDQHFVLEGQGLDALARHIQQGVVQTLVEYAIAVWPDRPSGPVVAAIKKIGADGKPSV